MPVEREGIWRLAQRIAPQAIAWRRHLHQHPELSFQEKETAAFVAARLREMGYEPQEGIGGYGVKAVLAGGAGPGPTLALRADMDALPIQEETGLPFASVRPGVMHACGHDVHTAVLLGAAQALRELQPRLRGHVVFIFQPGEETNPGGASLMIRDGVLENPKVDAIFGLHVFPSLPAGHMAFGAGPKLAAPDEFDLTILGRGGHGAAPHRTVDAVYVAAQVVVALQGIVSRNVDPFAPAVVTVGSIHGGSKHNIIAGEVHLQGTIRTMDPAVRDLVHRRVQEVVAGVCAAYGAEYRLRFDPGYPVLVNDPAMTELARRAAQAVLGPGKVHEMPPSMGGEDFAYFLQRVPGSFARLGAGRPGDPDPAGLHSSRLNVDEACIPTGIAYYLALALQYLAEGGGDPAPGGNGSG